MIPMPPTKSSKKKKSVFCHFSDDISSNRMRVKRQGACVGAYRVLRGVRDTMIPLGMTSFPHHEGGVLPRGVCVGALGRL